MLSFSSINFLIPEMVLVFAIIFLVMFGMMLNKRQKYLYGYFSVFALVISFFSLSNSNSDSVILILNNLSDHLGYVAFSKGVILAISVCVTLLSIGSNIYEFTKDYEYYVLILFSTLGGLVLVSSADFISLYMGIELLSLPLYALVALDTKNMLSSEASIKYFILGVLASVISIYGMSLIYGFSGTTNFQALSSLYSSDAFSIALGVGFVIMLCGLFFKVAAAPFYMWAPDVYSGSSAPVLTFIASMPKVAVILTLIKLLSNYFDWAKSIWQPTILAVACFSLVVGSLGALFQTNIKRLLAYSAIGHIGFILLGISAGDEGMASAVFYSVVYVTMSLGVFAVIIMLQDNGAENSDIKIFSGFSKSNPILSVAMVIILLSMAGIPPFAGFLIKFYVLRDILDYHYGIAILAVISAAISAFYYLKIIKMMYFNDVEVKFLSRSFSIEVAVILVFAVVLNSILIFFPAVFEFWISGFIQSLGN